MQDWWQNADANVQDVIRNLGPRRCTADNWTYEIVQYRIEGPLATIKLNDIRGANGLSNKMTSALTDIVVDLHSRPDVSVAVFTAGGAYFCTGGAFGGNTADDDHMYAQKPDPTLSDVDRETSCNMPTAQLFFLLNTLPQYKVASIRGKNMGAGNSLIASMDYVFAPDTKKTGFSFLESTRALSFCMSWQGILSKIGVPKARSLVLISDEVDSNGGKVIGLVDEVITGNSAEAAMRASDELAAAKGAEVAKLSKEEIRKLKTTGPGGTRTKLLEVPTAARGCQGLQRAAPDYQEAVSEVIAKCSRTGRPAPARLSKELWEHKCLEFERSGQHVATIRLKNAEGENKLDRAMVNALLDAVIELHKSVGKVRLLCVYAEGSSSFCSGLGDDVSPADEELQQMLFLFWMLPMYVMGFIDGKVAGHGLAFCAAMDAALARSSATFDFKGVPVQSGGEFITARVGTQALEDFSRSGAKKTADEAAAMGLVTNVMTKKEMQDHLEYVCKCLSQCAPNAVSQSKAVLQTVGSNTIDMTILEFMSRHVAKRSLDPEFNDAIIAITNPMHKPAFNRHDHSGVLPPGSGVAAMPAVEDTQKPKTKGKAAKLPSSVMI